MNATLVRCGPASHWPSHRERLCRLRLARMTTPFGVDFRGPDGRLGYLLRHAQHALWIALEGALRPLGITPRNSACCGWFSRARRAPVSRRQHVQPAVHGQAGQRLFRSVCWVR
jgi:hypothetical protein